MNGRRWSHRVLIAVALLLAMSHVCALPGHVHAAASPPADQEAAAHHHGEERHQHSVPAAGDSHLESCEGLRSAPSPFAVVLAAVPAVTTLTVTTSAARQLSRVSFVAESPPLFLLHAALRI